MAERRGRGEGQVYFEHRSGTQHKPTGPASDPDNKLYHRGCSGVWRGEVVIRNAAGRRVVRKRVNAATKTDLYRRLKELREEMAQGISSATYTVQAACDDWLDSLTDKAPKTVKTQREMLTPSWTRSSRSCSATLRPIT